MFQHDPILLSYKTNNELLYFYSALVTGWTNNECRHIANASMLHAILLNLMKILVFVIFGPFFSNNKSFGQTEKFFPGRTLYWTNLQTPKFLDSLKSLKLLTYKNKGVVSNKIFYREINEDDSLRKFKTTLDFYEYKLRWKHKGKKRFSEREKGTFYFYYGHAAAIYIDKYFQKE
jgi:hypothetical protein